MSTSPSVQLMNYKSDAFWTECINLFTVGLSDHERDGEAGLLIGAGWPFQTQHVHVAREQRYISS
jgi:hypothetical protein